MFIACTEAPVRRDAWHCVMEESAGCSTSKVVHTMSDYSWIVLFPATLKSNHSGIKDPTEMFHSRKQASKDSSPRSWLSRKLERDFYYLAFHPRKLHLISLKTIVWQKLQAKWRFENFCYWRLYIGKRFLCTLQVATNNAALTSLCDCLAMQWRKNDSYLTGADSYVGPGAFCLFLQARLFQYIGLQRRKNAWRSAVSHQLLPPIWRHNAVSTSTHGTIPNWHCLVFSNMAFKSSLTYLPVRTSESPGTRFITGSRGYFWWILIGWHRV